MATSSSAIESDATFNSFYCEVKQIEKQDAVLTSAQQIERLLRPGATYRNLNPFEVLQIDPDLPVQDLKKKYKRMSILVHPDKNPDDRERAQTAFDIINKAYKALEDENTRKKCMDVVEEAKFKVDSAIADKRKKLKKEGRKDAAVDEDDPDKYKRAIQVQTMKLFADMERKRKELETRDQEERKRKREAEIEEEENKKAQKEWNKNFECGDTAAASTCAQHWGRVGRAARRPVPLLGRCGAGRYRVRWPRPPPLPPATVAVNCRPDQGPLCDRHGRISFCCQPNDNQDGCAVAAVSAVKTYAASSHAICIPGVKMTRSAVRRITFSDATSSGTCACSEVSAMNVCVCASKGCGGRPAPPGSDGSCRAPAHWLQPGSQSAPAHTQLPAALTSDPFVYRNGWKIDCCPRNTCLELEGLRPVGSPTLPCVVLLTASAQLGSADSDGGAAVLYC